MKVYVIFKNNEEEYEDYYDWIIEIYNNKEIAEKRFIELVKANQYKKDRTINKVKYNENIGAYRIEEHKLTGEIEENKEIEELETSISHSETYESVVENREKINELVRAVNKLTKE